MEVDLPRVEVHAVLDGDRLVDERPHLPQPRLRAFYHLIRILYVEAIAYDKI